MEPDFDEYERDTAARRKMREFNQFVFDWFTLTWFWILLAIAMGVCIHLLTR